MAVTYPLASEAKHFRLKRKIALASHLLVASRIAAQLCVKV